MLASASESTSKTLAVEARPPEHDWNHWPRVLCLQLLSQTIEAKVRSSTKLAHKRDQQCQEPSHRCQICRSFCRLPYDGQDTKLCRSSGLGKWRCWGDIVSFSECGEAHLRQCLHVSPPLLSKSTCWPPTAVMLYRCVARVSRYQDQTSAPRTLTTMAIGVIR